MDFDFEIDPFEALGYFYDGEKLGEFEGDFIKNERKRNLKLPSMLKKFLAEYAFFNVNDGESILFLSDKIDPDTAKVEGESREILIIGKSYQHLVAILKDDYDKDDPILLFDELPEEKDGELVSLVFEPTKLRMSDFLTMMLIESPNVYDNSEVFFGESAEKLMSELEPEVKEKLIKIMADKTKPNRAIHWNRTEKYFLATVRTKERDLIVRFTPRFAIRELESLFQAEFYGNAVECDYGHALEILRRLISYWLTVEHAAPILAEKYKLAGRCCWELKKWKDAEYNYNQAKQYYRDILMEAIDKNADFYEGLGSFYVAKEDTYKSLAAFSEVDRLRDFAGTNNPRKKGNRLMGQGRMMMDALNYEKAIELYEAALAEYQKDPKDCKYDIARCQQLKGEAKKAQREALVKKCK